MKLVVMLLLTICGFVPAFAQKLEGEISYEQVYHWTQVYSRLSFISQEEKDRMKLTWGNDDESKHDMILYFNEKQSYYTYPKVEDVSGGYSGRNREYKIYRDFENGRRADVMEMLGKTYIVDDTLNVINWKVMNKIKEVAGHMCMMAVATDTVKNQKITAWFADDIPVSAGPELYSGLPGMILELDINDGDIVTTAKEIKLKPLTEDISVPKKQKGKKINEEKYHEMISTHIRDSIKAHRNPFGWGGLPY